MENAKNLTGNGGEMTEIEYLGLGMDGCKGEALRLISFDGPGEIV